MAGWRGWTAVTASVLLSLMAGCAALDMGISHVGSDGIEPWSDPVSAARAKAYMKKTFRIQNQSLNGQGSGRVNPSPGVYNWTLLDFRVNLMRDTGEVLVMRLYDAPDWMRVNASDPHSALNASHYADFAQLCAKAAARYPDVTHFEVWNEAKGFVERGEVWRPDLYTEMYNLVWDAVKAVRPAAKIGGPYAPISRDQLPPGSSGEVSGPWGAVSPDANHFLTYWQNYSHGYDFVAIDGHLGHAADGTPEPDPITATGIFGAMSTWIAQQFPDSPLWWSEFYPIPCSTYWPPASHWNESYAATVYQAAVDQVKDNSAVILHWPAITTPNCRGMFNTTLDGPNGGFPSVLYGIAVSVNHHNYARAGDSDFTP